jgi:anti-sigma B factor antagonist/stage II sporulation protein AA (anti-sigma F factor antagonist)
VKLAEVQVDDATAAPIVRIRGEIDLSNADAVRSEIVAAVPASASGVVIDLTETTYLDSSGIRLLFELAERLQTRRQRLALVVTEAALVRRVLVLTKLDDAVPLFADVDGALESIAER